MATIARHCNFLFIEGRPITDIVGNIDTVRHGTDMGQCNSKRIDSVATPLEKPDPATGNREVEPAVLSDRISGR